MQSGYHTGILQNSSKACVVKDGVQVKPYQEYCAPC